MIINQWVDFFVSKIKVYIQVDGVYWHGLNRPIEVISNMLTSQDEKIFKQIKRDKKLNDFMNFNGLKLVRITDEQINLLSNEELIRMIEV